MLAARACQHEACAWRAAGAGAGACGEFLESALRPRRDKEKQTADCGFTKVFSQSDNAAHRAQFIHILTKFSELISIFRRYGCRSDYKRF